MQIVLKPPRTFVVSAQVKREKVLMGITCTIKELNSIVSSPTTSFKEVTSPRKIRKVGNPYMGGTFLMKTSNMSMISPIR